MGFIITILSFFITSILIPVLIIWFIVKLIKARKHSSSTDTTSSAAPTNYSKPTAPEQKLDIAPTTPTPAPAAAPVGTIKYFSQDDIKNVDYMNVRQHADLGIRMGYMTAFAEAGDPGAQYELGYAYYFGNELVAQDWVKAEELFLKARSGGANNATTFLAMLYFEKTCEILDASLNQNEPPEVYWPKADPTYDRGAAYLAESLADYNSLALRIYSRNFSSDWVKGKLGDITLEKTDKALVSEIAKLKEKDTKWSYYVLGMFHLRGIGVKSDILQAKAYLTKAAELGDYSAKIELENPIFAFDDEDDDE